MNRLTRKADFAVIAREGKRARTRFLNVWAVPSPLSHPRVGIVVPKHGQAVVDRNRLKRRLREIVRVELLPDMGSMDIVIRARDEAYRASFTDLRNQVLHAGSQLRRALQQGG